MFATRVCSRPVSIALNQARTSGYQAEPSPVKT